jgi:tetrahydromethanopterin S-methyltransferase subunit B
MKDKILFTVLTLLLISISLPSPAQPIALSDSSLRETLTRAVQWWKLGKAKEAYLSLDTITGQPMTTENAATKIKASLWTANYLQAQRKIKPAAAFLDSAMIWAEKNALSDELIRTYEAYAEWHLASGNPKTAIVAREAAWKIKDSLNRQGVQERIDSLENVIDQLNEQKSEIINDKLSDRDAVREEAASWKQWFYLLSAVCLALLVIIFLMNGTLQRLKNAPPAPAPASPRTRVEPVVTPPPTPAPVQQKKETKTITPVEKEKIAVAPVAAPEPLRPLAPPPLSTKDIKFKLQDVELVLIRADVLAQYQNGETKAVRNILNEYMAQLPFIMKTLDDAITKNESDPILLSLEHLKQYLQAFGMQGTLKLIVEIEEEAKTEKVSKLLSRVFQVRNHCRRAADEAKALLEKLS